MPSGATLQLVSYGAQDIYLTGNPQITYFKMVYRRHTNFSMEDVIIDRLANKALSSTTDIEISRDTTVDTTAAMYIPTGTTAQRTSANSGIRFNHQTTNRGGVVQGKILIEMSNNTHIIVKKYITKISWVERDDTYYKLNNFTKR